MNIIGEDKDDSFNDDFDFLEYQILNQRFGLCPECKQSNTDENWCKNCNAKRFQQNFGNWTSGNENVDKFIQESQLKARNKYELLEWIPYTQLRNIRYHAQGGFSTIYKGFWLDGRIDYWDYEKQEWKRRVFELDENNYKYTNNSEIKNPLKSTEKYGYFIILKSLNDSSNINENFLNEWKLYLQCQHKMRANGCLIIPLHGITQDPDTFNYMVVMVEAINNLRNSLLEIKHNPNDKFRILDFISRQLESIHKLNLVHGDFHSGNILETGYGIVFISDLGLCRPVNLSNTKNDIYGVLPYMAPEVLRGEPYTKAADIYSLGIIMWELTSGVPAFHNISFDFQLSLDICKDIRPEIIEGTMPEYVELMKRCWDTNPKKRPTAKELKWIFMEWNKKYPLEEDNEKRVPIPESEPKITYHPKSCYTCRKINYSFKLNEYLAQDSLSDKIVIVNDKIISENLDEFKI
ncbi:hypothetical protein RclHR1_11090003 [Rhizophagus clarus]|uniref:Kinase-like domain-containing protein n=1 Tax=Rhizophagus clarus TaxID=94130 RepID=A0A2Z6Q4X3_9GLOM|nr:hypothetical protein RclHR1_11090003 [Rhizophagus clarus]GES79584.1 kinase-like domain-containing protein [Rhizophagus clarus]